MIQSAAANGRAALVTVPMAGYVSADANEDNLVDAEDYAMWKSNFGRSESSGAGGLAIVPEPSTPLLALFAACSFVPRRIYRPF